MAKPVHGDAAAHAGLAPPGRAAPAQPGEAGPAAAAPARPTAGPGPARPPGLWARHSRALTLAALVPVAAGLFLCYLTVSRKVPVTSDGASNALQAWNMLHGNWLLHGWWLSDVSFYTTELPEYVLVEIVRGLTTDVVHVAAAVTYTVLVLGAAWLARGPAAGRAAAARMLLAGGIMLAPQLAGARVLMLAPDHLGSAVPVLAVLLLLDRAPPRWWVPVLTGAVLAWSLVADDILIVTAVLPLLVICTGRVARTLAGRRPLRSCWLELSLIGAALAAAGLSRAALAVIAARGGFILWPVRARLVPWPRVLTHLTVLPRGLALLFGASTASHTVLADGLALLHLAGLGLAIWGVGAALWRFRRLGLVDQLLVATVLINLLAYLFLTPGALLYSARDYSAVLPLAAALAGRMAGRRLLSPRLMPVLAAVLAGYALSLAVAMSAPAMPARNARLVTWLAAHHLDYGLGAYGTGSSATLYSGGRVRILVIEFHGGHCYPHRWEAQASSYDPRLHDATFVVQAVPDATIRAVFGAPVHVYRIGATRILVWDKNLLADVQRPSLARPGAGILPHG